MKKEETKTNYANERCFEMLGAFLQSNGKYEEVCEPIETYSLNNIPSSVSLDYDGKKVKCLCIEIRWDVPYLIETIDGEAYCKVFGLEQPQELYDRSKAWLENDKFLSWAIRKSLEELIQNPTN